MKAASFTYYGSTEDKNRVVRFYKNKYGSYTCSVEGTSALTITHPSYERVRAAFEGWYVFSSKDWGASDIDWGDMQTVTASRESKNDRE